MFSEPKIISTKDLKARSYITFYFDGERIREYNGNELKIYGYEKINNYSDKFDLTVSNFIKGIEHAFQVFLDIR